MGKHRVQSPKVFARGSGLVDPLLGLPTVSDVLGRPLERSSWEAFVIETLIVAAPDASGSFYGTAAGTEVDLIFGLDGPQGRWAIEIKHSASPSVSKRLHNAIASLKPHALS